MVAWTRVIMVKVKGWVRVEGTERREMDCFCGLNDRVDVSVIN